METIKNEQENRLPNRSGWKQNILQIDQKTGGTQAAFWVCCEKKKNIRKYVIAYGEVDDKTFQTQNLQGERYQNLLEETGEMQTQTMFGKALDVPYKLPSSFK